MQAFPDDIYGGVGRSSRGGPQRGVTQDPFGAAPPMTSAPPGGRALPAGYTIPPQVTAPRPDVPRPAQANPHQANPQPANSQQAKPSPAAGARQAADEQASAKMSAAAETARQEARHQEAMQALKAAGEARSAGNPQMSASHAAAQAAAQMAAHVAARSTPQSPRVPMAEPQSTPRTAPAGQVLTGIPLDQVYAQMMGSVVDPFAAVNPNPVYADPRGVYNPMAGNPSLAGNVSARIPTGTVGVGQITGQIPAVGPYGTVGGIYSGVVQPGIYGAAQAQTPAKQPANSGATAEEAWLIAMGCTADDFLDATPQQRILMLAGAGCDISKLNVVYPAVMLWAARKTGRVPQYYSNTTTGLTISGANRIVQALPAGQAVTPAANYTIPILVLLAAAAAGTYMYVSAQKKHESRKQTVRASRRASRRTPYSASRLPEPRGLPSGL